MLTLDAVPQLGNAVTPLPEPAAGIAGDVSFQSALETEARNQEDPAECTVSHSTALINGSELSAPEESGDNTSGTSRSKTGTTAPGNVVRWHDAERQDLPSDDNKEGERSRSPGTEPDAMSVFPAVPPFPASQPPGQTPIQDQAESGFVLASEESPVQPKPAVAEEARKLEPEYTTIAKSGKEDANLEWIPPNPEPFEAVPHIVPHIDRHEVASPAIASSTPEFEHDEQARGSDSQPGSSSHFNLRHSGTGKAEPVPDVETPPSHAVLENSVPIREQGTAPVATFMPAAQHQTVSIPSVPPMAAPDALNLGRLSDGFTSIDRDSVISQLVEKAELFVKEKSSEMVVSLKPEFLGRITLRASVAENMLMTTILTESASVKKLLESDLPELQRMLEETGLNAATIVVTQEADTTSSYLGQPGPHANHGHSAAHQQHSPAFRQPDTPQHLKTYDRYGAGADPGLPAPPTDSRYVERSIHYIA